jgi:hypothetical protein
MKYAPYIGVLAAMLLIISCFFPWAYYPDIQQTFTGFYSHENTYGRPGKAFIFLALLVTIFLLIPQLWAKRAGLVTGIVNLAYAIKTFILFTSCYNGICPEKKAGIFVVIFSAIIILMASLFTGVKIPEEKDENR